jgi:hypothetical protein
MADIDFIEFHDATVERIEHRGDGTVVIVFDHLYVCERRGDDRGGWSYRAELMLGGVSNLVKEGNLVPGMPHAKDEPPTVSDGEVRDAGDAEVDPLLLLHRVPARRFWIHLFGRTEQLKLSADIVDARLVLLEAVERLEDCYIDREPGDGRRN